MDQKGAGLIDAQRVLRVFFSGEDGEGDEEFWGTQVGSGDIDARTEIEKTFSTTLNSSWVQDNFTIVATIWKKSGNTVKAISVDDVPGDVTPVINNPVQVSEQNRFILNSNGKADVKFYNMKEGNVKLYIYDMAGRVIARPLDAWLKSEQHTVTVNTPDQAAGVYNYRLVMPDKIIADKLIVSHN